MNYVDDNLKKVNQDKTIGIIICKLKFHCGVEVTFTSQELWKSRLKGLFFLFIYGVLWYNYYVIIS